LHTLSFYQGAALLKGKAALLLSKLELKVISYLISRPVHERHVTAYLCMKVLYMIEAKFVYLYYDNRLVYRMRFFQADANYHTSMSSKILRELSGFNLFSIFPNNCGSISGSSTVFSDIQSFAKSICFPMILLV